MSKKPTIDPNIPNLQDGVRHKSSAYSATGIVIAKYKNPSMLPGEWLLDVRRDDDKKIEYATPAKNWERINTEEERFE